MIRTILAEEHLMIRDGLKMIFETAGDIALAGEVATAGEAIKVSSQNPWDLIVARFSLQDENVFRILEYWSGRRPSAPILVTCMRDDLDLAIRLFQSGARGFVPTRSSGSVLLDAARAVANGKRYVSPEVVEHMADRLQEPNVDPIHKLTNREYQIMILMAKGLRTGEIAAKMKIQSNTVSTYKKHIRTKLRIGSDALVVRFVAERELAP